MDTNRVIRVLQPGKGGIGKLVVALALTALLATLVASTASAGKFGSSQGNCTWPPFSAPFAQWNDLNWYFPVAGGSFEGNSASGWTLSGGASIGSPNEPWNVNNSSDAMSLGIPNGGSATSAPVCVTANSPALRLFSVNTGNSDRQLQVSVNFTGTDGKAHSAKLQNQQNRGSWAPSQQIRFVDAIQDVLNKNGQAMVTFTFTSSYQKDRPGSWRIDDLYVDDVAGYCDWPSMSSPFAPWRDYSPYFLLAGASFEDGATGWTLSGGAGVGAPNEPWSVNSGGDHLSLGIPSGASATSPQVCVTVNSPSLRLFYVNSGGSDRPLQLSLNYIGNDGKPHTAKLDDQKNGGAWAPSQPMNFLDRIKDVLKKNGQTLVSFTFTSQNQKDRPGNWRIDDIYIDPLKSQ